MPTFDDLTFVPASMTRLPLEGYGKLRHNCGPAAGLSNGRSSSRYRSISPQCLSVRCPPAPRKPSVMELPRSAHTCTGGIRRRAHRDRQLVYQITPACYGLDLDHLRRADGLEVLMGQGLARTGGLLLGMKVSPRVSQMRTLPEGVDQRSTVRPRLSWRRSRCQDRGIAHRDGLPSTNYR